MEIAPIRVVGRTWVKGPAKIVNGEVVLDIDRTEEYEFRSPESSEQMAFELAILPWDKRDEREVVRFVRRYGLLTHGAEDLNRGMNRESLEDWWHEATTLHFVGACYEALSASAASGSATRIKQFFRRYDITFPEADRYIENHEQVYMTIASDWLSHFINSGMNGRGIETQRCKWELNAIGPGEFRLSQHPPDLLSRAYAAFATLIASKVETRFCQVCGKQFRPKTKRSWGCCPAHTNTLRSQKNRED